MSVALIVDGRAREVWPSREDMAGKYPVAFIDSLTDVPDDVLAGYWQTSDGWSAAEPQPPLTEKDYAEAIQEHVDATARAKGYADGVALAGYSTSTIPAWAAEAQTFIGWRDQVWLYAYTELAKVQGGQREVPTIAELIGELPTINWP